MVASQQIDRVFKLDLEGHDEGHHLDGERPPVDVVSQKQVLGGLKCAAGVVVDQLEKVIVLSVQIAHYGYRILQFDEIGLLLCMGSWVLTICLVRLMSSS